MVAMATKQDLLKIRSRVLRTRIGFEPCVAAGVRDF